MTGLRAIASVNHERRYSTPGVGDQAGCVGGPWGLCVSCGQHHGIEVNIPDAMKEGNVFGYRKIDFTREVRQPP